MIPLVDLCAALPSTPVRRAPQLCLPVLSEVFGGPLADAAGPGFVLAALPRGRPVLWVQDRLTRRESGQINGLAAGRVLLVMSVSRPADVLTAMEEGLSCPALGGVVGEIWGAPPALDFTATRRLALRAETVQRPCWLIRRAASADASAARLRWRVGSLASDRNPDDPAAPGDPVWRAELFRSRLSPQGEWLVRHDRTTDRVEFRDLGTAPGVQGKDPRALAMMGAPRRGVSPDD